MENLYFFLFPLKTKWQKPKHFGQMCGKNSFGIVANGLWESLLGCLIPLLSSPSRRMTVPPEMDCGNSSALASLQRESAWGKNLSPGANTGELLCRNTLEPYEQMSKFQVSRFLFKQIKRVLRRKKKKTNLSKQLWLKLGFYLFWEDSERIILSPSVHSSALAQTP